MKLFIFFATLIIFSRYNECYSTTVRANEGEEALLIFNHPCDYTQVTIRHGYLSPFYDSANAESNPLPSNIHVTHVHQNMTATKKCSIKLIISPVLRDDAGTYILTLYKDGQLLPEYPRIRLHVSYPPGKASCTSSNDYYDGEWASLHCTAPVGNIAGQIVCYQNDMRLPSLGKPLEDGGLLNQKILIRLAELVFCCACIVNKYTNSSDCADCAWDPIRNIALSNFQDTSPTFLSMQDPTLSKDTIRTYPTLPSSLQNATGKPFNHDICGHSSNHTLYILIGILTLLSITFAVLYCHKMMENKKL